MVFLMKVPVIFWRLSKPIAKKAANKVNFSTIFIACVTVKVLFNIRRSANNA